jgi:hypothetical protein
MFQLHDRTRRKIVLGLFFPLCVAPTLLVLGWCLWRRTPAHARRAAEHLGWQMGMKVSLESVRDLRPGAVRYEGLALFSPETGRRVLFCPQIEARWTSENSRPVLVLTATAPPELAASELDELARLVERVLSGRAGWAEANVHLRAAEAVMVAESGRHPFAAVRARIESLCGAEAAGGPEPTVRKAVAELVFEPPGTTAGVEPRLSIQRIRQIGPWPGDPEPVTELVLDTGDALLPCPVLAALDPIAGRLGPAAWFQGTIRSLSGRGPWSAEIAGTFSHVDLQRLLADRIEPMHLSGTAHRIEVAHLWLSGGVVQDVEATIDARDGTISRGLIEAAARHLRLTSALRPNDPAELSFDRLAARATLDARGLSLRPLPNAAQGAILSDRDGVILRAEHSGPAPSIAIAEILSAIRR